MEIGSTVFFIHKVNGEQDYLKGIFIELLPNGKYLVRTEDNVEFELDKDEIKQ